MFVLGVNNPPTAPPMNASKKSMNSAGRYSVGAAQQESDLGKLLRTVQKAAISRDSNVMEIVLHPISCGYFLDFSQKCVSLVWKQCDFCKYVLTLTINTLLVLCRKLEFLYGCG
jgi:hypothetical protein